MGRERQVMSSFIDTVTVLTIACAATFVGFYLCYFAICMLAIRVKKPPRVRKFHAQTNSVVPSVSMIVPVYNEASVISRKLENLQAIQYPNQKLEAIFVDGASTDGTLELIERYAMGDRCRVKIVRQGARRGFNIAVIDGFREAVGDVICIPGAETVYDPQALNLMVRHFEDDNICAVTGTQRLSNPTRGLSPRVEKGYRDVYDFLRTAESIIDSPFDMKGEISAARRRIIAELVEDERFLRRGAIDTACVFQGKIDGFKTIYEPEAVYYEQAPESLRDSFKQGSRRGAVLIQNLMIFKGLILNPRYGAFGMLIVPAHLCLLVILPLIFLAALSGMVVLALNGSGYALAFVALGLLCTILSRRIQAILRAQIVLVVALLSLLTGVETQMLERLQSTRR
jgi:cellulose synthase/poly-beta-1,6-N-acetylglucosamine synthase-like glycosyltransferase